MAVHKFMLVLIGVILTGYAFSIAADSFIVLGILTLLTIPVVISAVINWNRYLDD